ncbi:hypothetical protein [Pedobacter sp. Leaf194]|uniref:hypothetical protein n=1 Tax=Pedobacter sp. Leaf194 TaxID=1736297 RepID=UPI0007029B92|nr:hypothetical protein [Pedobacter sp. Leaf194]KQS41636.1 hypothetical protein ASG14_04040 [Pedobacter sp. Leaf194]
MKTNPYNNEEHLEGYVGSGEESPSKSDVQKAYEKGNEGNEVTSFGQETDLRIKGNTAARDGFDNSGTQGKDSLSDDTYGNKDENATIASAESKRGSSSKDFKDKPSSSQRNEDDVLNSGI